MTLVCYTVDPMPTYEYECAAGHRYEKREGFDAPATQKCPKCRKTARRVLHAPPIVFKGSGFYVTDSRGSTASKSEAASESSSESSSESTPDAKPAEAKPESNPDDSSATKPDKKADKAAAPS